MKYTKPNEAIEGLRFHCRNDSPTSQGLALLKWIDSLPAEFEIVEPGNVQVKWPKELTKQRLLEICNPIREMTGEARIALADFAAIAPEEKKKRKVELWRHQNSAVIHIFAEGCNPNGSEPPHLWRKVGECEIEE